MNCPRCGAQFSAWYRASCNEMLDGDAPGDLNRATCPSHGRTARIRPELIVSDDDTWTLRAE